MTSKLLSIKVDQLNANDEFVKLVKWSVNNGDQVEKDQLICSVETTKCVNEIFAPRSGIIRLIVTEEGSMVKVGGVLGVIADSMTEIDKYLFDQSDVSTVPSNKMAVTADGIRATPRAKALAQEQGIDLADVVRMGIQGSIKESDVIKYMAIPSALRTLVIDKGKLPDYEDFVARKLKSSREETLPLTMDAVLDMTKVNAYIDQVKQQGLTISLLHIILAALPETLEKHERFKSFQARQRLFTYRRADIAFIVRTLDGKLSMPVIHDLAAMNIEQIAEVSQSLAMEAMKGRLKPAQVMGACFCVSYIAKGSIARFEAYMDEFQSGMLAVAAPQAGWRMVDGQLVATTTTVLTLTYDHTLIDGWTAGEFLSDLIQKIERITSCPIKIN